jgi:glycerol-3-phosphate dehydrogenase (NAD+)
MWVYEEKINGENLTDIINTRHENVKYLPTIQLPSNLIACPDLIQTCENANVLIIVAPHQFLRPLLKQLKGKIPSDTICVNLIKGIEANPITGSLKRYSEIISEELQVDRVAALMGANVAMDIALEHFAETTIASEDLETAYIVAALFHNQRYFRTQVI